MLFTQEIIIELKLQNIISSPEKSFILCTPQSLPLFWPRTPEINFACSKLHINTIVWCILFCVHPVSFIHLYSFTQCHEIPLQSCLIFSILNRIPSCEYNITYLFNILLLDQWFPLFWLLWINCNEYSCICLLVNISTYLCWVYS